MRALWSGSLSFGLINIPIKLFSATKENALKFKLLEKDNMCPIVYNRVCKFDNREVDYENIIRGFEYGKNNYIPIDKKDFEKANAKKTKTIEIVSFAKASEIDAKYFDKPYYIEPEKGAEKAYVLLREALKKSKKVGVAKFVIHSREHIATIRTEKDLLMLEQLRYANEIRNPADLAIPSEKKFSEKELQIAMMLMDQLTEPFDISKYKDTFTDELMKVIEAKAQGRDYRNKVEVPSNTQMRDLLNQLKKSLELEKKKHQHA